MNMHTRPLSPVVVLGFLMVAQHSLVTHAQEVASVAREGWESGCHFDIEKSDPTTKHAEFDALLHVLSTGASRPARKRAVCKLTAALPMCRRQAYVEAFQRGQDEELARLYGDFIVWGDLTECLPGIQAWADSLRPHAADPIDHDDESKRAHWMDFYLLCDALGDRTRTKDLLVEVARNCAEGNVKWLHATRMLCRAQSAEVLAFLRDILAAPSSCCSPIAGVREAPSR